MLPLHIYNNTQQAQVLRAWTRSFWPLNAMLVSRTEADLKFWSQGIGFVASGTVSQPLTWRNCCCCWWWCFLVFFLSVRASMSVRDIAGQLEIYYAYKSGFLQPQRQFTGRRALALIFQLPVYVSVCPPPSCRTCLKLSSVCRTAYSAPSLPKKKHLMDDSPWNPHGPFRK